MCHARGHALKNLTFFFYCGEINRIWFSVVCIILFCYDNCRNSRSRSRQKGKEQQGNRRTVERTEEHRNRGTEEQRNKGTEEQRNRGTEEQRNRGMEERRNGATEQRSNGATEQQSNSPYRGTEVHCFWVTCYVHESKLRMFPLVSGRHVGVPY